SGFNHPIAGQSAWVNSSGGYVSVLANLPATVGSTVQFRWSVATDFSNGGGGEIGVAIDNVQVSNAVQTNLSVTKTDFVTTVQAGDLVTYTITVTNFGDDVSGVTISDAFPLAFTNVTFTATSINPGNPGNPATGFT